MNKKYTANTAAVVEIGSNSVSMQIAQLKKGEISVLDTLEYPVALGHDVFETGLISFERLRELSGVLVKFSAVRQSYGIEKSTVISCTVLREAANRSLVSDQLAVQNRVSVRILEDSEEKAFIYSEVIRRLRETPSLPEGNSMIAYIGSGSIGVAVFDGKKIIDCQNIPMGALKLHDMMGALYRRSDEFHIMIEEYLDSILGRIDLKSYQIKNLILTGPEAETIARFSGAEEENGILRIRTKKLAGLYDSIRSMTAEKLSLRFGVPEEKATVLYTALSIHAAMLRFCPEAESVLSPSVTISQAVMRHTLMPKAETEFRDYVRESALACAEHTASRFHCSQSHTAVIREYACRIFDKMKKIHGLDAHKRLLLELAAILHSCGSYVSVRRHNSCTFDLVKGMDLFGLCQRDVIAVACMAGNDEGSVPPDVGGFPLLSEAEKIEISKLTAIFRLANALDKSHKGKIKNLKIGMEEDKILFRADAGCNTMLEQWAFEECSAFFKEVFGLSPELLIKSDLF